MFGIGAGEFVVILIVALIVFGPSKLPEIGRSLGKLLREFRKAQAALSATLNEIDEPAKKSEPPTSAPEKNSAAQGVTADDVIQTAKAQPIANTEKISATSSATVDDVINSAKAQPIVNAGKISTPSSVTVDDVIHSAKAQPIVNAGKISATSSVTVDDVINSAKAQPIVNAEKISTPSSATADDIHLAKERPIVKESSNEKISDGNSDDAPADDARASLAGAGGSPNGTDKQSQPATDGTINSRR